MRIRKDWNRNPQTMMVINWEGFKPESKICKILMNIILVLPALLNSFDNSAPVRALRPSRSVEESGF